MRICIPTTNDKGRLSELSDHFGSAPSFVIYDSDANTFQTVANSNAEHEHGTCHPMSNLHGLGIDAIVCKGIGRRALQRLHENGIKVYRADVHSVDEVARSLGQAKLEEISAQDACHGHDCH